MRLNSLHLTNFRQHVDTHIDFDVGITGIIGPNGSGKSTILEAIAWALYGTPAARGTRDTIRWHRAAARAPVRVELDFELAGHRYVVTRGLNDAELYLDGANSPIATSTRGVTELLHRRLGMSHDEFFNTYFTGQNELSVMAAMGPSERAQFLSRVLGYERLRTAQGFARDHRKAIVAEATGLRAAMPDPDEVNRRLSDTQNRALDAKVRATAAEKRREASKKVIDEITPRWDAMQRDREAVQTLLGEIRLATSEREVIDRDSARINGELAEIAAARAEFDRTREELEPLAALQAEVKELARAFNEEGRRKTLTETMKSIEDDLARLRERHALIATAPELETEATQVLAQARVEREETERAFENTRGEWIRDKQEAETKRNALLEQLRDVQAQRDQIVSLGEKGTCPICARPLETHFRTVLDTLDEQIDAITQNGKYFRSRIDQLEAMPAELKTLDERRKLVFETVNKLERRLAKVQAAVSELATVSREIATKDERLAAMKAELATVAVGYDAARHETVKRLLERLEPIDARAKKLAVQIEREPRILEQREAVASRLATVDARLRELAERREKIVFSEQAFADLRAKHDAAVADYRAAELGAVQAKSELAAAHDAFEAAERAKAELAKNEARLAELTRDRRLHEELDRAFTEIRGDLNVELRPEISDLASRFIRELTDGRYSDIELDEQYNIIVLEDGIPKPVISGGEEDLANLVLRLAISEMIAERAGQSFSLLILDEVFGSLDETRRHNVIDLLRRLQDRFEQVILITHIESVREGLDRVVSVRYDEESGTSRVDAEERGGNLSLDLSGATAGAAD
jgi:exonuclease SbcC